MRLPYPDDSVGNASPLTFPHREKKALLPLQFRHHQQRTIESHPNRFQRDILIQALDGLLITADAAQFVLGEKAIQQTLDKAPQPHQLAIGKKGRMRTSQARFANAHAIGLFAVQPSQFGI
jgi:hypothetical protein